MRRETIINKQYHAEFLMFKNDQDHLHLHSHPNLNERYLSLELIYIRIFVPTCLLRRSESAFADAMKLYEYLFGIRFKVNFFSCIGQIILQEGRGRMRLNAKLTN